MCDLPNNLSSREQLELVKISLTELSQYWKMRARGLAGHNSVANMAAIELHDCASQLDRILAGDTTEADGFRSEDSSEYKDGDRVGSYVIPAK